MPPKVTVKGQIIKEYLRKFPNTPDKTIGVKIYKENKSSFKSEKNAYDLVRFYRGHKGNRSKEQASHKEFFKPITNDTNPFKFKLPESSSFVRKDYFLPKANDKILMVSDIHFPYQINEALFLVLERGYKIGINTLYLNGDILDMYQASFHERDARKRSIKDELDTIRDFFDSVQRDLPGVKIYYKEGNHEMRLSRYLMHKAPELLDCEEFELAQLLKLGERGIEWIPNKKVVQIGKLYALHGNEFKGGGGVSPARAYYLKSGVSMIAGDKHRTTEYTETLLNENTITTWSTGCLCELNPEYLPFGNKWNLGAADITVHKSGDYHVNNFRIIKDEHTKLLKIV